MRTLDTLVKKNFIRELSKIYFKRDSVCKYYELEKLKRIYFQNKLIVSTSKPLDLLYMDLFWPIRYESLNGC